MRSGLMSDEGYNEFDAAQEFAENYCSICEHSQVCTEMCNRDRFLDFREAYEDFCKNRTVLTDTHNRYRNEKNGPEKTLKEFISRVDEDAALKTIADMVLSAGCYFKDGRISKKNVEFFIEHHPEFKGVTAKEIEVFYRDEYNFHRPYVDDSIHRSHLDQIASEARKFFEERWQ